MAEIASAYVSLMPSLRGFRGQLNRQMGPDLDKVGNGGGKRLGDGMTKSFKGATAKMFTGIAAGIATLGAASFFKDAIQGASDLNEAGTKVEAIFGKVGKTYVDAFSKKGAKALGQTQLEVLNAASTFGTFGKAAGLSGKELAGFSTGLAGLSTDFSSFFNTSPATAVEAIGAALRGEAEPIRQFGILLDDASLKAEAMRLGLLKPTKDANKIMAAQANLIVSQKRYNDVVKKSGKDSLPAIKAQAALGSAQSSLAKATGGTVGTLTQQQKILAANSLIYQQSKDAQGDFARTSGGLANQQRILGAQFKDLRSKIGQQLLPTAVKFATFLNEKFIPGVIKLGKKVGTVFSNMKNAFNFGSEWESKSPFESLAKGARKVFDFFHDKAIPGVKAFFDGFKNGEAGYASDTFDKIARAGIKVRDFLLKAKDNARAFFDGLRGNTAWAQPFEKFAIAGSKVRNAFITIKDKGVAFWGWLKNDLFPALQTAATEIMPSLQTALAILKGDNSSGIGGASFSFKTLGDLITQKIIPFLTELAKVWLPAVALNIRKGIDMVIAFHDAFISFKDGVSSAASYILHTFSTFASGFAIVLASLGSIPGFGWATDAATKLQDAATKAGLLAAEIDGLNGKKATIQVNLKTQQGRLQIGTESVNVGMRAKGGPVTAGQPYIVGEKRPELFVPNRSGKIIPQLPEGATASGGGVTQNFNGNIVAHDYDDFERKMDVKRRRAAAAAV